MRKEYQSVPGKLWVISLTEELARRVHKAVARWSKLDREHLADQWIRAVDSIGLNVSATKNLATESRSHS